MKKILTALVVILAICVSFNSLADDDIIGTWYLTEMVQNGQSVNAANAGVAMTMDVKSNMTFTLSYNNESQTGIWSRQGGKYIIDGEEAALNNGKLSITTNGVTMVFSRQSNTSTVPQPVGASSEEDFLGEWTVDQIGANGVVVPVAIAPESMSFDFSMSIKSGAAIINMGMNGSSYSFDYDTEYLNGKLVLSSSVYDTLGLSFAPIEKTDDGGIMTTFTMNYSGASETATLYMKKTQSNTTGSILDIRKTQSQGHSDENSNSKSYHYDEANMYFIIPNGWEERPLSQERKVIKMKMSPIDDKLATSIMFGCEDMWSMIPEKTRKSWGLYSREDLDAMMDSELLATMADLDATDIKMVTYAGIQYGICIIEQNSGIGITIKQKYALTIKNGYFVMFQMYDPDSIYNNIFETVLNSVSFD